jgi:hypothetical protein
MHTILSENQDLEIAVSKLRHDLGRAEADKSALQEAVNSEDSTRAQLSDLQLRYAA